MSIDGSWHRRVQGQLIALDRLIDLDATDIDTAFENLDTMPERLRALADLIDLERSDDIAMLHGSGWRDTSARQAELRRTAFDPAS